MQYGQIVFILFILLLVYYAAMIVLDLQKARMAQAAEQENQGEEDIDISDEAKSFQPIKVSREESKSKKGNDAAEGNGKGQPSSGSGEKAKSLKEKKSTARTTARHWALARLWWKTS